MSAVADVGEAKVRLDASPDSARAARRFVRDTLVAWGCESRVDTVTLLTNELVTNAVLHARSRVELSLHRHGGALRVEVADGSPAAPVRRDYGADQATTGRGLALVEALAAVWGVESSDRGKSIWFEVPA